METLVVAAVALIGLGSTAVLTALGRLGMGLAAARGRLETLERRLARLEHLGGVTTAPTRARSAASNAVVTRRLDAPKGFAPVGRTLIAVPNLSAVGASKGSRTKASARAELRRRFAVICELADAGGSAESIARATGQPVGRVELVLGLRRRAGAGPAAGPRRP